MPGRHGEEDASQVPVQQRARHVHAKLATGVHMLNN